MKRKSRCLVMTEVIELEKKANVVLKEVEASGGVTETLVQLAGH